MDSDFLGKSEREREIYRSHVPKSRSHRKARASCAFIAPLITDDRTPVVRRRR